MRANEIRRFDKLS